MFSLQNLPTRLVHSAPRGDAAKVAALAAAPRAGPSNAVAATSTAVKSIAEGIAVGDVAGTVTVARRAQTHASAVTMRCDAGGQRARPVVAGADRR